MIFPVLFLQAQEIETPEIDFVTVNNTNQSVDIQWSYSNKEIIDGYIIKRFIYQAPGVVDNTYNTIAVINDPNVSFFEDTTTVYGKASPGIRTEKYRIAAFINTETGMKLSVMSSIHSTILPEISYDVCSNSNTINWNKYNAWSNKLEKYEIYSRKNAEAFALIGNSSATDSSFIHKKVEENTNYDYLIKAVNFNSNISESVFSSIFTNTITFSGKITCESILSINNNNIEISFKVPEDKNIISFSLIRKSDKNFDTISNFEHNPDTILKYTDTVESTNKKYTYFLVGKNFCNKTVIHSGTASNLVIFGKVSNVSYKSNMIFMDEDDFDLTKFDYNIYRSENNQTFNLFSDIQTNTFIDDISQIFLEQLQQGNLTGEFCYYIETFNKETNELYSRSNSLCVFQEERFLIPNAFNPDSEIEENRTFKPKTAFINSYSIQIFSRRGELIFSSNNSHSAWDGKYKGQICPVGVYYYNIEYKNSEGKKTNYSGSVSLVRNK